LNTPFSRQIIISVLGELVDRGRVLVCGVEQFAVVCAREERGRENRAGVLAIRRLCRTDSELSVLPVENYRWSSAPWYVKGRSVGVKIEPGF